MIHALFLFIASWQVVCCRDSGDCRRAPLYRLAPPKGWERIDPAPDESIQDSQKANVTFKVGAIEITLHTFPTSIPPSAQVARWEEQLSPVWQEATPQSFGGFVGLFWEGVTEERATLGWALMLAPEYHIEESVTIKAVGPREEIEKERETICRFARTFQRIAELREPL